MLVCSIGSYAQTFFFGVGVGMVVLGAAFYWYTSRKR